MSAPHWRNSSHEEQTGSHGATSGWRLSRLTLSSSTRESQLLTDSPADESTRMTVCSLLTRDEQYLSIYIASHQYRPFFGILLYCHCIDGELKKWKLYCHCIDDRLKMEIVLPLY